MPENREAPDPRLAGLPGGPESTFHLLERLRAGDQAALDALFARYLVPLRRWASGRLPRWARDVTDTQDLVQEALLQTFKKIEDFESRHEGALQAYLRQVLMNRIRDELRRHRRRGAPELLDSQAPDEGASQLDMAIGRQAVERYEQALASLRPEEREAIIARIELGCSYEDLAIALGRPSAEAARKAAQRALIKLAAEMERLGHR